MVESTIHFAIGFNFDPDLISGLIEANAAYGSSTRVAEVFGALRDSPVSSARPTTRIPDVPRELFRTQVADLRNAGIRFNYLLNTAQTLDHSLAWKLRSYLEDLLSDDVEHLTVGTPELGRFIKENYPEFHITLSITFGACSVEHVKLAEDSGLDAVYLDGVKVNRDFTRLRTILHAAQIECRLYANMSCLANCPVVRDHYRLFAGTQGEEINSRNDAFFAGCSLAKLKNPVEWIQMPWIRPEDIRSYAAEGIQHFKLADRLAPTDVLLTIVRAYLNLRSPEDLFVLMERDGNKYRLIDNGYVKPPLRVRSSAIPLNFLDHFRAGECKSTNLHCPVCHNVAMSAIDRSAWTAHAAVPAPLQDLIPAKLRYRIKRATDANAHT